MRVLRTPDGNVITGRDARSVIRALRDASTPRTRTTRDFIAILATRVRAQYGVSVRTGSASELVADLEKAGLLREAGDE